MRIRPIRTEADYEAALAEIERLFNAKPGSPAADRLEVLSMLVEAYEERQFPMPDVDPVEAIRYHLESRGLTRDDLAPYLGGRQTAKEVLARKRSLTLHMIRRLRAGLGISADLLVGPYRVLETAA